MEVFVTAKLSYSNENRIEYQLYAEFLRLAGIYVWERCECEEEEMPGQLESAPEILYYRIKSSGMIYGNDGSFSGNAQLRKLTGLVRQWEIKLKKTEFEEAFPILLNGFVLNALFEADATLQYFRMDSDLVEAAGDKFQSVAHWLGKMMKEKEIYHNRHLRYARLYCLQKANYAYYLRKKPVAMDVDILAEQCDELLEEYPDFTNVWVLKGMVYEIVPQRLRNSINAFEHALSGVKPYPFLSSIYYWIGKRYEGVEMYRDRMEMAYQNAYRLDSKYRIIYKMGMLYEKGRDWEEALLYYQKCISKILMKKKYLDPLEQEYFFKTHIRMAYIYLDQMKRYERSIDMVNKALHLRKKIKEGMEQEKANFETKFYYDMYGKRKAIDYIKLELSRMGTRQAYKFLSMAYKNLGDLEKSRIYAGMIEW